MSAANRHPENANLKPGAPPSAKTGSEGQQTVKTRTDPSSGETTSAGHAKNKSAAEDRSPAAQKDRRIRADE